MKALGWFYDFGAKLSKRRSKFDSIIRHMKSTCMKSGTEMMKLNVVLEFHSFDDSRSFTRRSFLKSYFLGGS